MTYKYIVCYSAQEIDTTGYSIMYEDGVFMEGIYEDYEEAKKFANIVVKDSMEDMGSYGSGIKVYIAEIKEVLHHEHRS